MSLSLADHLQSKYFQDDTVDDAQDLVQIHLPAKKITSLSAADQPIDSVGSLTADLSQCLPCVTALDLSNTSISDLKLIKDILALFPNLTDLIVSRNPQLSCTSVAQCIEKDETSAPVPSSISSVIASKCSYTWSDVIFFAQHLWPPSIESLTLHGNAISTICIPERTSFLSELTHLDLSDNPLKEWKQICNLAHLRRLSSLNLSRCSIDSINFASTEGEFSHLVTLNIRENHLSSWLDVVALRKLPSLRELNVKGNPLFASLDDLTACHLTIVRLPHLRKVNNAEINSNTMKEAEKYYINKFYSQYQSADETWFQLHPTFKDILERVGPPAVNSKKGLSYISLTFESAIDGSKVEKKIPASTKIGDLKMMVKRLFRLPLQSTVDLTWRTAENTSFEYPLDEERSQIGSYELGKDDRITVRPSI